MKKGSPKNRNQDAIAMRSEYDFRGGVRGKHYRAYRRGHVVKIHRADGSVITHHFSLKEGSVMLDPDLHRHFPTSEAVNKALRSLVSYA